MEPTEKRFEITSEEYHHLEVKLANPRLAKDAAFHQVLRAMKAVPEHGIKVAPNGRLHLYWSDSPDQLEQDLTSALDTYEERVR